MTKYKASEMNTYEDAKAFLDREFGEDWYNRIDLETLAMANQKKCVLGQLGGDYYEVGEKFFDGDMLSQQPFGGNTSINWEQKILELREKEGSMKQNKWLCTWSDSYYFTKGCTYIQSSDNSLIDDTDSNYRFNRPLPDKGVYRSVLCEFTLVEEDEQEDEELIFPNADVVIAWMKGYDIKSSDGLVIPGCNTLSICLPGFHRTYQYTILPKKDPKKEEITKIEGEMRKLADRLNELKG